MVTPTGSGKTAVYHFAAAYDRTRFVVVVIPTVALI